ncbi:hypothetical protein LguiA_019313 [Lonicera macranthoides]
MELNKSIILSSRLIIGGGILNRGGLTIRCLVTRSLLRNNEILGLTYLNIRNTTLLQFYPLVFPLLAIYESPNYTIYTLTNQNHKAANTRKKEDEAQWCWCTASGVCGGSANDQGGTRDGHQLWPSGLVFGAMCVLSLTNGGTPVPACCTGLKSITAMASDLNEKRDACKCVKNAVNRVSNLKDGAALSLPQKCGVHMNIPISQTINCDA